MISVLFAAGTLLHYVFGILMFVVAVFLILLVLVQRGRGGGLTGALGGMGGQSAFGTKAGDTFTRVTMVTAGVWIILCMLAIWLLASQDEWSRSGKARPDRGGATAPVLPEKPEPSGATTPAAGGAAETKAAPSSTSAPSPDASPAAPAPKAKE